MVELVAVPQPPPRHTGNNDEDIIAALEWADGFYKAAVINGFFINSLPSTETIVIDPADLPDPATATAATAQQTANDAFILAAAAFNGLPIVGSGTVSETGTTFVHVFTDAQPDTDYKVTCTAVSSTGTPVAGSSTVVDIAKTVSGFTVTVEVAPGAGNSITFDFMVAR